MEVLVLLGSMYLAYTIARHERNKKKTKKVKLGNCGSYVMKVNLKATFPESGAKI